MITRPIQIYLDSSDYSNFSNPKVLEKAPKLSGTLDFLYKCVEKGAVDIRFSAFTVAEIMHVDDDARPYAVQRAKILMELTKGKTLRPNFDLFTEDAIYLGVQATQRPTIRRFPDYAYLENNDWIDKSRWPDFSFGLKTDALEQIRQYLKSLNIPRNKRREAEKSLFQKNKITPEFARLISGYFSSGAQIKKNEFTLWQEFTSEEMLINFLSGKVSDKLFTEILFKKIMDVEFFISKICDYEPEIREKFVFFIKGEGNRLIGRLTRLLNEIDEGKSDLLSSGFSEDDLDAKLKKQYSSITVRAMKEARQRLLSNLYNEYKSKIKSSGLKWQDWDSYVINSNIGNIPSLDTILILLMQYFLDKAKDSQSQPCLSDAADLLHSGYAPYCDIFRTDKWIVELVSKASKFINFEGTVFLKNSEELPQTIIGKASSRGIQL
jgi:hypothetical protein